MEIREVRPHEHTELGALTVAAYRPLGPSASYADKLADVAGRAAAAHVLVAVDDDGTLLGGVTYVAPGENPMAEHVEDGVASIRMLAVAPTAHRRGVGVALTRAAMDRARRDGAHAMVLHSTTAMTAAHRLYEGLGFERVPELDWVPEPDVQLLGFRIAL